MPADLRVNGRGVSRREARQLIESTVALQEQEAIARHQTATDTESDWDGPQAVADAPEDGDVLRYMHTVFMGGDPDVKANYKLPHHRPGTSTAANISGVNNALARLPQTQGIEGAQDAAEDHLRGHRRDAGLEETMTAPEIREAAQAVGVDPAVLAAQEGTALTEDATLTETGSLVERDDQNNTIRIKVIEPGQGSSGEYPPDVLERDGPRVFTQGLHMYWDHPTRSEEDDRPERSLRDLAAVLTSDARWDGNGPDGPGLYADARVFQPFRDHLGELAEHIGVSIRAAGQVEPGDSGPVVTRLSHAHSVDFVTLPGAGGSIVSLFEAVGKALTEQHGLSANEMQDALHQALTSRFPDVDFVFVLDYGEDWVVFELKPEDGTFRQFRMGYTVTDGQVALSGQPVEVITRYEYVPVTQDSPSQGGGEAPLPEAGQPTDPSEEDAMADAQLQEQVTSLNAQVAQLTESQQQAETRAQEAETRAERAEDALLTRQARDHARSTVDEQASDLPDRARSRVIEQAVSQIPTGDDGKLDADKLTEQVTQAASEERAYLAEAVGAGKVSGMGGSSPESGPTTVEDYKNLGLSESDAKAAARIHA